MKKGKENLKAKTAYACYITCNFKVLGFFDDMDFPIDSGETPEEEERICKEIIKAGWTKVKAVTLQEANIMPRQFEEEDFQTLIAR